jgi:hypothetical protein
MISPVVKEKTLHNMMGNPASSRYVRDRLSASGKRLQLNRSQHDHGRENRHQLYGDRGNSQPQYAGIPGSNSREKQKEEEKISPSPDG